MVRLLFTWSCEHKITRPRLLAILREAFQRRRSFSGTIACGAAAGPTRPSSISSSSIESRSSELQLDFEEPNHGYEAQHGRPAGGEAIFYNGSAKGVRQSRIQKICRFVSMDQFFDSPNKSETLPASTTSSPACRLTSSTTSSHVSSAVESTVSPTALFAATTSRSIRDTAYAWFSA